MSKSKSTSVVARQPIAVAASGVNTRHEPTMLWASRASYGSKVASGLGQVGAAVLVPHGVGPKCKANTVWGVCYAECKRLAAAGNGSFTVADLYAALVAYDWQTAGVANKHVQAMQAAHGSPAHNAYLGWCAQVARQATATRFSCAVRKAD
jgi:hypothetical protein